MTEKEFDDAIKAMTGILLKTTAIDIAHPRSILCMGAGIRKLTCYHCLTQTSQSDVINHKKAPYLAICPACGHSTFFTDPNTLQHYEDLYNE
ncbi:hypothetical protein EOPP23_06830 [Endozoicomonas sp. OPT23]|uniref:hypothetical protein n=1 Tax=Endozoicomonas sp. OPT23 TaxID=2072845 RepID=UPI00129A376C|nr:hypothetical protein [Endozoicomonas sp. OPT23]MRI32700.1 hypothetical protein [Endozoicomonas sp. OPT23]